MPVKNVSHCLSVKQIIFHEQNVLNRIHCENHAWCFFERTRKDHHPAQEKIAQVCHKVSMNTGQVRT